MLEGIIVGPSGLVGSVAELEDHCLLAYNVSRFENALRAGRAWCWASLTYDPDAADTILALRNDAPGLTLCVKRLWFTSDTASQIQVWAANLAAIVMAGTAVVGVNARRELAGGVPPATAFADETGNGEAALVYPGLLQRRVVGANGCVEIDLEEKLALPFGHAIGIDLTTAATAANAAILGWYE